jgi:amino acid adenylation domain-containing protein
MLQGYVARQAEKRPDAIALVMGEQRVSYGELEAESNQLARLLLQHGCRRGDRICLFLPKTPSAVMAMVSVLKAGCTYVPIDVDSPARRVAKVIGATEPRAIIATSSTRPLVDELFTLGSFDAAVTVGSIDDFASEGANFRAVFASTDWRAESTEPLGHFGSPEDPAHLLFTSGSTGTPKGVVIQHSNVIAFVDWAVDYFGMGASDKISGHPPLHFDLSTFDIYGAQAAGAELHLIPPSLNLMANKLAQLIRDSELTQWFSVPSAMTYMAKMGAVRPGEFPLLERVLWCGEVLPTPTLIHWMQCLPQARFTNMYGPTEATIASSYYTMPACPTRETESIPIGTACPGEELLIMDDGLQPAPLGAIGDLYIAGVGLSPGYWRDEEKTRAVFREDPRSPGSSERIYKTGDLARIGQDGLAYFLGRADTQIKSRGHRIELGEIEMALSALECLRESAVIAMEADGFEGWTICCAYVSAEREGARPARLKEMLRESLPPYMLPSRWLAIDELPKNANGKIDRRALRERFEKMGRT